MKLLAFGNNIAIICSECLKIGAIKLPVQNFNISDLVIDKNYINPAILDHEILFDNKVDALSQFNLRLKELIAQSK